MATRTPEAAPPRLNAPTPALLVSASGDQLLTMILTLAAEVSSLADEVDDLRRALLKKGSLTQEELSALVTNEEAGQARAARRLSFVKALMLAVRLQDQSPASND